MLFVLSSGISASAQTDPPGRPGLLMPLYAGHIALHGADLHSTFTALDRGLREANPLFSDGNRFRMVGAKVAISAVSIIATEKLRKRNPAAAVGLMVAANTGLTYLVARNYRLAASAR
jgi:hypothetical protein